MEQAKRVLDPRQPAQPRRARRPRPVRRRPAAGRAAAAASGPTLRLTHDGGSFSAAVHRCTGVGKCVADNTASGGVMCPSYLATREEKDSTRGRAHVLQDVVDGRASGSTTRPSPSRSTCACPARAVPATARPASTWRPTSPRRSPSATPASCGRAPTTPSAQLPRWARLTPPRLANAALRSRTAGPAGQVGGGRRPATEPPALLRAPAARSPGAAGRERRRVDLGRLVHRPVRGRHRSRSDRAARGRWACARRSSPRRRAAD